MYGCRVITPVIPTPAEGDRGAADNADDARPVPGAVLHPALEYGFPAAVLKAFADPVLHEPSIQLTKPLPKVLKLEVGSGLYFDPKPKVF